MATVGHRTLMLYDVFRFWKCKFRPWGWSDKLFKEWFIM